MKFARSKQSRRVLTVAAFATTVSLLGATPFTPGVSYKVRTVMNMPPMPGMGAGDLVIVGHGVSANGKSRLDIDSAASGPMTPFGPGDYILTLDSGRTVVVTPASKTYIDNFMMGGGMPPEVMSQAVISGISVNVEKQGAGETIEGRATQKYKLTAQYTMSIMGTVINMGQETEIMTADLPTKIATGLGGSLSKSMSTGPFAELYTKMTDAQKQISGTPIKVSNVTSIMPMNMNLTQTMTITDLKNTDVDEKSFAIPDGFTARPPGL
ncbi:MAG TPA: hypothetical protein VIV65_10185 [Gemmatimonadaceae bacterium]|jgi:hypothetical protein